MKVLLQVESATVDANSRHAFPHSFEKLVMEILLGVEHAAVNACYLES